MRFYKEILYYPMFQNKAGTHLKLKEILNCSFREDLLLHLTLAIILPWDAQQRSLHPSPPQTIIVVCAPTWDIDNKK